MGVGVWIVCFEQAEIRGRGDFGCSHVRGEICREAVFRIMMR